MLRFRLANEKDVDLLYHWANDPQVRENSFNTDKIEYEGHCAWFKKKLLNPHCRFYIFEESSPVGVVRIEKNNQEAIIGISIDVSYRGRGFSSEMISLASADYLSQNNDVKMIIAEIKLANNSSLKAFLKAEYQHLACQSDRYQLVFWRKE